MLPVVDYFPVARNRFVRLKSACLVIGVIVLIGLLRPWIRDPVTAADQASAADSNAMLAAAQLARQMIAQHGPGVSGEGDNARITSFRAFFLFIAKLRIWTVSTPDAPNPFPGLLPGKHYSRLKGDSVSGNDVLIATETYDRPIGVVRSWVQCDGDWKLEIKPQYRSPGRYLVPGFACMIMVLVMIGGYRAVRKYLTKSTDNGTA